MSNKAIIANATLFKDEEDGSSYRIGWVPLDELVIDPDYQREADTIAKLMKGYNPRLFDPILASYRPVEDKFFIIDGNHRAEVARKRGKEIVVCKILEDLTKEEEALEFAKQDACNTKLTPYDRYKASLAGKDSVVLELRKVLNEYGVRVVKNNPYGRPKCLCCLSYAWETLKSKHIVWLRWVLDIYKKTKWHEITGAYSKEWFIAFTSIYSQYGGRVDVQDVLIRELRKYTPHDVKLDARRRFPSGSPTNSIVQWCIQTIETEGKWTTLDNMMAGD